MKLLITGAAGFIGSHFVEMATRAGHQVLAVDALTYAGRRANLPHHQVTRGDICDHVHMEALFACFQPDAVVHLAAESHVGRSIDSRDEFLRTNVGGTGTLLEVALPYWREKRDFRFIHVSTDEVYGSLSEDAEPWTEASPYQPNNPYAASKAASDHLVRSYWKTFGLPAIITHSSNNYGDRQHPEKLIPRLIRQVAAGEPMTIHGDGLNVRDWMHVNDHCRGLLATLDPDLGQPGETYNFGGQTERTNLEIAKLIAATMGRPGHRIVHTDDRPGNDRRYSTNVQKAWRRLAWMPIERLDETIHDTVRWYLDNPQYDLSYGK